MYELRDAEWRVYDRYNNLYLALMEARRSPYVLIIVNTVTGQVIADNTDWK